MIVNVFQTQNGNPSFRQSADAKLVPVAISLTICSMVSALQPTPRECVAWSSSVLAVSDSVPVAKKRLWNGNGADERLNQAQRTKCLG